MSANGLARSFRGRRRSLAEAGADWFKLRATKKPLQPESWRGFLIYARLGGFGLGQTLTLGALTSKFASAAHSFCLLASLLFGRLLKMGTGFHFPEETLTLHLLF